MSQDYEDYEGKRKQGMPIPDFATKEFFQALPMLASLPREQMEAILSFAAYLFLITNATSTSAPRLEPREATLRDTAVIITAACKVFAANYGMPRKEVVRLIIAIISWLRKRKWTLHAVHNKEGGGSTFFSTADVKVIVVGGTAN
jgi:hypothetical protein